MSATLPPSVLGLDPSYAQLTSSQQDALLAELADACKTNLYFLASAVLGYDKLVPQFHKPLCQIVQDTGYNRKLYLLPRGTYKTTIITKADSIRQILINPNVRILITNATAENACKILWEIRTKLEENELLRVLFPGLVPDLVKANRWNNTEILVTRSANWSEATIEAIGVGGTVTSRHYDIHKKDDIIDEKIASSPTEMSKAKEWLAFTEGTWVNPRDGREDIIGTRYALNDPYGEIISESCQTASELPTFYNRPFVSNGYLCFMRAAKESGVCTCPELLDEITLERIKRKQGKKIYSSQFLNYPFTSDTKSFDRAWLRYYDYDHEGNIKIVDPDTHATEVIPKAGLFITMRVDPASGESTSTNDRSAVVVDGVDGKGRVFVLEAIAKKCKWFELYDLMCEHYRRYFPVRVGMEMVAMAKIMGSQFKEHARKKGLSPYLVALKPSGKTNKESRISAYDARFEAGEIFIRKSMTDFISEYEAFPDPSVPDDLLDAFAYGDQFWIKPQSEEEQSSWDAEERHVLAFRKRSRTGY